MDLFLSQFIITLREPISMAFFLFITHLSDATSLTILTIILTLWLLWKLQISRAIIFAAGMIFSGLLTQFLKLLTMRPRPNFAVLSQDGFSFPSGHALGAMVFFGFLLFIILQSTKNRWIKLVFSILLPLLILATGFSRVYLGVHWVTDVIGGWAIGGLILAVMIKIMKYLEQFKYVFH